MSITADQWAELVEWINTRYPDHPWRAEQAVAYFYDLDGMDTADVWSGLFTLYQAGRAFAPTGSELLAAARREAAKSAREEMYARGGKALPEPRDSGPMSWSDFSKARYGEELRPAEVIRREHAKLTTCASTRCEIHRGGEA